MSDPSSATPPTWWLPKLFTLSAFLSLAAALVLVGGVARALALELVGNRAGATISALDRVRVVSVSAAGATTVLLLAAVAVGVGLRLWPRGEAQPTSAKVARPAALGLAVVFVLLQVADVVFGVLESGSAVHGSPTLGDLFANLASIVVAGTAAWWVLASSEAPPADASAFTPLLGPTAGPAGHGE